MLEGAPDGLVQQVRERAHLGDEGEPAAADLADGAAAHQHPLADRVPVHPPDLDRGIVPAAVEDVGLGDGVRGQHALGVLRVDREIGAAADLRGGEAGLGLVGDAAERERPVVVGEAEDDAVGALDAPAPGERRRAAVEMRLQARRTGSSSPHLDERDRGDRAEPVEVPGDVEPVGVEAHRHVELEAGGDEDAGAGRGARR